MNNHIYIPTVYRDRLGRPISESIYKLECYPDSSLAIEKTFLHGMSANPVGKREVLLPATDDFLYVASDGNIYCCKMGKSNRVFQKEVWLRLAAVPGLFETEDEAINCLIEESLLAWDERFHRQTEKTLEFIQGWTTDRIRYSSKILWGCTIASKKDSKFEEKTRENIMVTLKEHMGISPSDQKL
jgi:hypothetical protein